MTDLAQRLHAVMGGMIGNEALVASLDEDAASEWFSWGELAAKRIVDQTDGLDDDEAEAYMAPRLRALRLMMRAVARWVVEADALDAGARLALWNRAQEQARILFGEAFTLPPMQEALTRWPAGADAARGIAWLKDLIDEQASKG